MTKTKPAFSAILICCGIAAALAVSAWAQPPQRNSGGPMQRGKGPPRNMNAPANDGPPGKGDRPEPGSVLPPFVRDQLQLTDDQMKKIAELESDVKTKLKRILTDDQMKQFEDLMHRGPPGMNGQRNGPSDRGGPPEGQDRSSRSHAAGNEKTLAASDLTDEMQQHAKQFHKNVTVSFTSTDMIVQSNGIPDHETGKFPNEHNPNTIKPQNYRFVIPLHPQRADAATPTPMGPIGVAINGVPFYNQYNAQMQNAVEGPTAELFDSCCGHPDPMGRYHYHKYPVCVHNPFKDQEQAGQHSPLIGYAFDGYAIFGPKGEDGKPPQDLDECNGHTDSQRGYHYHVTAKYPYILGAYRGVVEQANLEHPSPGPH